MAKKKSDGVEVRCIGCGKIMRRRSRAYFIGKGIVAEDGTFKEREWWGIAHERCFERFYESPKNVLDEIRRISRKKPASKKA